MTKENDFGFIVLEEEQPDVYQHTIYVDKKAKEIYDLIFPFLDTLRKSEGDIIKWPAAKRTFEITKMLSNMRAIISEGTTKENEIKKLTPEEIQFQKDMGIIKI